MSQHLASKELDDLIREAEQPIFGFWWGVGLGFVIGAWAGYNMGHLFTRFQGFAKAGYALFSPSIEPEDNEAAVAQPQPRRR